MVTQKIFIRLGKLDSGKYKVDANLKHNIKTLFNSGDSRNNKAIPTVHFAINVDIPDEKFDLEKVPAADINFKLEEDRLIVKCVEAL